MKKYEKEIEIDATPDEVWRALTEAEELKRWFPLDARVTPGVGGALWLSWGEGSEWEAPIEVWEPSKHLRTVDTTPGKDGAPPTRVAVDYIIESRGGKTVLRLVHSGFADDMWDDEFETLSSGWAAFQANLKHYLERHRGEPRYDGVRSSWARGAAPPGGIPTDARGPRHAIHGWTTRRGPLFNDVAGRRSVRGRSQGPDTPDSLHGNR